MRNISSYRDPQYHVNNQQHNILSIYSVLLYTLPILCFLAPPSTVCSTLSSLQDVVLPLSSSHSPFEKTPNWFRTLSTPQRYNLLVPCTVTHTRTRYSYPLLALATRYSLLALELAMRHSHSRGIRLALARARINTHSERVEHSRVKDKLLVSTRALAFKFHVICTVRSGTHKDLLFWC